MCQFKSFIVTKDGVLWSKKTDSHDKILAEHGIKDKKPTADFVKVELIPQNGDPARLADYIFHVDQDNTPSWWTPEYAAFAEHECRAVLKKIMRRHKTHWPGDLMLREYSKLDFSKIKVVYGYANLSGCAGLTSVAGATFHGNANLEGCTGLTSVAGATFHGYAYLSGCAGLKSVAGVTFHGNANLEGCTGLTSVAGATFHGYAYLSGCAGLKSVAGVTFHGNAYLEGCTGIKSLPEDIEIPGDLYLYETNIKVPASAKIGGRIYRRD